MDIIINVAVFLISAVIFTFVGMYIRKKLAESKMKSAEAEAKKMKSNTGTYGKAVYNAIVNSFSTYPSKR